jgi:hypothetical protein
MKRDRVVPRVTRHVSNNVTNTIFSALGLEGKGYKLKPCTYCGEHKIYSDFYVKSDRQHIHPDNIQAKDLRGYCIPCYDVYHSGRKN